MASQQSDFVVSDDGEDGSFSMSVSAKPKTAATKKAVPKAKATPKPKATKTGEAKKKAEPLSRRKSNETADEGRDGDADMAFEREASPARAAPLPATSAKTATQTYTKVSGHGGESVCMYFCSLSHART